MPPVLIYTKASCPFCIAAKDLLRRKGAAFEETRVWQRRDGRWRHVHFHRSPVRIQQS